jgi:hypothetical protein
MNFRPPRTIGLLIGILLLLGLFSGIGFSVFQMASETVSPFLGIWTTLVVIGFPLALLVIYRLYGLLTAEYILNRDGFYLRWGLATDQIPIADIAALQPQSGYPGVSRPRLGIWWPGCITGQSHSEEFGLTEFFACSTIKGNVIIQLRNRVIVITPPDVQDFMQAFSEIVQMGALEEIPEISQRPDFFSARLWADRYARGLIGLGLILILALLASVSYQVSRLESTVPFSFDEFGVPDLFVPPARLLILPLVGGVFWVADLVIGSWLYRMDKNRPVAYLVWGMGVVLVGMLWGAMINLIAAS